MKYASGSRVILFILIIAIATACGAEVAPPTPPPPTDTAVPPTATNTATPLPTNTPAPTATSTTTPTPTPLTASAIFDRIAPSIALVRTATGGGSGILVEGNYILTNAHVVWPYEAADVVFSDGSEFTGVPIVNWDLMADLAVLGPVEELAAPPLTLVDGEELIVGGDVYLIGYPGEVEDFPEATITRGLISRKREWEGAEITFFQTDAMIAGGQSGGALVSEMGEVIGISGFSFTEAGFGLVASAADVAPLLERLIAGEDTSGLGTRAVDSEDAGQEHDFRLAHSWDSAGFFLVTQDNGPIIVEAEGINDLAIRIISEYGEEMAFADGGYTGMEEAHVSAPGQGLYFVEVYQYQETPFIVSLSSESELIRIPDIDDDKRLLTGGMLRGAIDYPGDVDYFEIYLHKDEVINFYVDSANIDPYLTITYPGAGQAQQVEDDDSGGGLFGLNAELTYRAPHDGMFMVIVEDANLRNTGGYALTVSAEREDAPTPVAPEPTATPIGDPPMKLVEVAQFTMQVPFYWDDVTRRDPNCMGTCFKDEENFLTINVEDVGALLLTREEYVNLSLNNMSTILPNLSLNSRQTQVTESGLTVELVTYIAAEGQPVFHLDLLITFDDGIGFVAVYIVRAESYAELAEMIRYSFSTLALQE